MARFIGSNAQQGGDRSEPEQPRWTPEQLAAWHQQQAQQQQQAYWAQQQGVAPPHHPQQQFEPQPFASGWRQEEPRPGEPAYAPPYATPAGGVQAHVQHGGQDPHAADAWGRPQANPQSAWVDQRQPPPHDPLPQQGSSELSLAQIIEATRQQAAALPQAHDPRNGYSEAHWTQQHAAAHQHPTQAHPGHPHDSVSGQPNGHGDGEPQSWSLGAYQAQQPVGGLPHMNGAEQAYAQAPPHDSQSQGYAHGHYPAGGAMAQDADPRWLQQPGAAPHPGWPGHPAQAHAYSSGYDPHRQDALPPGYVYDANGQPVLVQAAEQQHTWAAEEAVEEKRRGPGMMLVAGALVGAIVLGGGLAYGYKLMTGGGSPARTNVVKADQAPTKSRPEQPGGKDVPHTDRKFLKQLNETTAPAPSRSAEAAPSDGPRRVSTIPIRPDGTVAAAPAAAPPPPVSSGIPGMVIEGGGPRPLPPRPPEGAAPRAEPSRTSDPPFVATPPPAPRQEAVVAPPRVAPPRVETRSVDEAPQARQREARAPAPPAEPQAEAPPKTPAVKRKAAARDDAAAPASVATTGATGGTTARVTTSSGGGFVTVLASRRTRDEAFRMFPDLESKFGEILAGKVPDVRETDLSAQGKGVVFRLVVGPPGSKEAAIDVCNKLKAQGFTGCWATPY